MAAALFASLLLAASPTMAALAADETEMADDFVPVELGSGNEGGAMEGSETTGPGNDAIPASQSPNVGSDYGSETEIDVGGEKAASTPSGSAHSRPGQGRTGVRLGDGSIVTVDEGGSLVLVDSSGAMRTLDSAHSFELVEHEDGTVAIAVDGGQELEVRGTSVIYADEAGKRIAVDTESAKAPSGKAATEPSGTGDGDGGASGVNETELGTDTKPSTATEAPAREGGIPYAAIALGAVVVAVAAFVLWKRRGQ
ncbi:MAG TPA: hypothetical protein DCP91_12210 [Eggerthellaceae bacterium]|nr:hypothetical protein [Eggerthellaceae bacterium]